MENLPDGVSSKKSAGRLNLFLSPMPVTLRRTINNLHALYQRNFSQGVHYITLHYDYEFVFKINVVQHKVKLGGLVVRASVSSSEVTGSYPEYYHYYLFLFFKLPSVP